MAGHFCRVTLCLASLINTMNLLPETPMSKRENPLVLERLSLRLHRTISAGRRLERKRKVLPCLN